MFILWRWYILDILFIPIAELLLNYSNKTNISLVLFFVKSLFQVHCVKNFYWQYLTLPNISFSLINLHLIRPIYSKGKKIKYHIQTYDTLYYDTWNLSWVLLILIFKMFDLCLIWHVLKWHTPALHRPDGTALSWQKPSYEVKGSLYFHQESLNKCPVEDRKNEYRGVEREMGWVSYGNTNPLSPSFPLFVSSRSLSPHLSFCSGQDDHQM